MTTHPDDEALASLIEHGLDSDEATARHVADCEHCRGLLAEVLETEGEMGEADALALAAELGIKAEETP
jgi:hypothetical protein